MKQSRIHILGILLTVLLCAAIIPALAAPHFAVDDQYTVALLHLNGDDASNAITDESGKTWTASGDAQLDTAQYVFGTASALFDGTGDYISAADSADWQLDGGSNTNLWTFDFRLRFAADPGTGNVGLIEQYATDSNFWNLFLTSNTLRWQIRTGGSTTVQMDFAWNPAADTWYHLAMVKDGSTGYLLFIDGAQVGTTQTDTDPMGDYAGSLRVGRRSYTSGVYQLNGWIDELRISKGVARWTSNFTPPAAEYGGISEADQTATAGAATATYWANQTATAAQATANYWANETATAAANQTATQEAANATATYWANATGTAAQATADYWTNATGTAAWLTANPPDLTATFVAQQTLTAAALTAGASLSTPQYSSVITYGDYAVVNGLAGLTCLIAVICVIWLVGHLIPERKRQ